MALALLRSAGPIAQSSANLTGHPPATTAEQARRQLGDTVHTYLDGGPTDMTVPSTIIDLTTADAPFILREGALPHTAIKEVLARP